MCDTVEDLALHDVRYRLAHLLAHLAVGQGERLVVWETHEELACWIGTRQDEVTKVLRDFRRQGLVSSEPRRRGIVVVDAERLASYGRE